MQRSNHSILPRLVGGWKSFIAAIVLLTAVAADGQQRRAPGQPLRIGPDPFDMMVNSAASFADDSPATVRAEFDPPVIAAGGRAVYRVVVTALEESLEAPGKLNAPAGMEVHAGGHGQTYQQVLQMTPGSTAVRMQPQTTFLYHVTATNTGSLTIPSFDLTAYGKPLKVPETTLLVVAAGAAAQEPPLLFADFPPGDIFVGQTLKVPVMLPMNLPGGARGISQAKINGEFLFTEPYSLGFRSENVTRNGKNFLAITTDVIVTLLHEGKQELIAQGFCPMVRSSSGQPNMLQSVNELLDSDPFTVTVKPLPEKGRLPGFNGAVGDYRIDSPRLSATEVLAGQPVTLLFNVRGEGSLGRLTPPPFPEAADWQGFLPPSDSSLPPMYVQQRGFVTFSYTLIPVKEGLTETPAIPFSCFDPQKKVYVDLTIPPLAIAVKHNPTPVSSFKQPVDTNANAMPDVPQDKEPEPMLAGLATAPGAPAVSLGPLQARGWFLGLQLVPASVLGGLWAWDRRRRFLRAHPEVILKRRARRGLRRQLRLARRAAAAQNTAGFIGSAANAFREACAPHSAANPEALVCADVLRELPEPDRAGRNGEIVRQLFSADDSLRFGELNGEAPAVLALQSELEMLLKQMRTRLS
jgi:hypothetical protein